MATDGLVYQVCPKCKGEGIIKPEQVTDENGEKPLGEVITCPVCKGEKELFWGRIEKS